MSKNPPAQVIELEEQKTVRWLSASLTAARERVAQEPTPDAVARIRLRVLGEAAPAVRDESLAA